MLQAWLAPLEFKTLGSGTIGVLIPHTRQENQFLPGKGKKLPGAIVLDFTTLPPSLMQNSSDLGHFKQN